MSEIPTPCVFNKGITGCGATQLAIKQPGHTVLAMPFVGLVENKASSNPELLAVHSKMGGKAEIVRYIKTHETIKIATTYDSLSLVCDTLVEQGINPYEECFLFIDEYHVIFNSYKFRKTMKTLLTISKKFVKRTFVSATPLPKEYGLVELQDLPIITVS